MKVAAKAPSVHWKQYQDRRSDNMLSSWFPRSGESNYWIGTGPISGVVVLDIDNDQAERWWREQVGFADAMDKTVCAKTSKGHHYYFKLPEGQSWKGWSQHTNELDFDVRADGQGVVVPPSIHESGVVYEWLRSPDDCEILPAPEWLTTREAVLRHAGLTAEVKPTNGTRQSLGGLLANPPRGGAGSGRNVWLTKVAGYLAREHRGSETEYRRALADANQTLGQPLDRGELGKIADSIWSSEAAKPNRVPLNDSELAEWVADRLRGQVCWANGLGWQKWDERKWSPISGPGITEVVRALLLAQYRQELATADADRRKSLSQLLNRSKIGAVVTLLQGLIEVEASQFDTRPDLLNVANGVVDLRSEKLLPHDPSLYLTKITEVPYRAGATHPDWEKALQAIPDPEVRDWLQVKLGQGATGHPGDDDVLPILQGGGSNGKTTVMTAILTALGQHAVAVPEKVLLANPSDHPTELMTLRGARFALLEELPEGRNLSVQRLKQTVGKPRLSARLIRENNVEWDATHTLVVTTNYDVRVTETDHGTWRRLAVVSFPLTYRRVGEKLRSDNDRWADEGLRERLRRGQDGQYEAALAWLVAGARRWYRAKQVTPPQPARVRTDTDELRGKTDLVMAFVAEQLAFDPDGAIQSSTLLDEFNRWATESGHSKWSDQTFASRLEAHDVIQAHNVTKDRRRVARLSLSTGQFVRSGKNPVRAWFGVRFRDPDEHQPTLT